MSESPYFVALAYLAQVRHFRKIHRAFSFTLLDWAASSRRRTIATLQANRKPVQISLFGEAA